MTSILNVFSNKETNKQINMKKISPSLKQGKKFKKYQNKIENSLEKKSEILSGKEGFSDMKDKSLTKQTDSIISNNNYSNQQQIIDNLRQEYQNTTQQYKDLVDKISGKLTDYVDRVNPNNPYLNKVVQFTTGDVCYVTSQGVVKYIPSNEIWKSANISQSIQVSLNIPFLKSYAIPGAQIPTNPPLIAGTKMQIGQSLGNEGSNIFVNQLLPSDTTPTYIGCYATNSSNNNMTFIGGTPPTNISIQNGNFSQPVIPNNSYQYFTWNASTVPGWNLDCVFLNNSTAWGFPIPYPNGNQCICIQGTQQLWSTVWVPFTAGVPYTLSLNACGRNCCDGSGLSNPIAIGLEGTTYYTLNAVVGEWQTYTITITPTTSGGQRLTFIGTYAEGDRSTALQGIALTNASSQGTYSYSDCEQAAITSGNRYFALQNTNPSTNLGYCAVSNSEPAVSQYGISQLPSKMITLWSSNTSGQSGNTAILQTSGSLQVINSGGQSVYSSPGGSPSNYLGCYNDCYQGRGLPTYLGGGQTYTSCQSAAQAGNWSYFGLQFTQANGTSQCWVGNDIANGTKMGKANNCTDISGGYVSGGGCSNAIYNNTSATSNYYLVLQDDGNMCVYRGTGPNDNQGQIWASGTNGQQKSANPQMAAANGKYGQNWMASGSSLAPGDFIGSNSGTTALVMQSDGNLVLYTYQMTTNCQKMSDGNIGGGVGANAAYDIGNIAVTGNMGLLGYVDADSNLYTYPSTNQTYTSNYMTINNMDTSGNDIQGASFSNTTLESCQEACNNNSECAGVVFDGNTCWPKTNQMFPFGNSVQQSTGTQINVRSKMPTSPPLGVSQNTNTTDSVTFQNYINKGQLGSQQLGSQGLANATSAQKQELQQLQTRMNLLSSQITDLTNKFQGGTLQVEKQNQKNNTGIDDYLKDIISTNKKIGIVSGVTNDNINNILTDSDIVVLQKNYDYLFWSILAAGAVLVSMNIVKKQ